MSPRRAPVSGNPTKTPRLLRQNATMTDRKIEGVFPNYYRCRNVARHTVLPEETTTNGHKAFYTTAAAAIRVSNVVDPTSSACASEATAYTQCQGDNRCCVSLPQQISYTIVHRRDRRDDQREERDCCEDGDNYNCGDARGHGDAMGTADNACSDRLQPADDKQRDADDSHEARYLEEAWERRCRLYTWLDQLDLAHTCLPTIHPLVCP